MSSGRLVIVERVYTHITHTERSTGGSSSSSCVCVCVCVSCPGKREKELLWAPWETQSRPDFRTVCTPQSSTHDIGHRGWWNALQCFSWAIASSGKCEKILIGRAWAKRSCAGGGRHVVAVTFDCCRVGDRFGSFPPSVARADMAHAELDATTITSPQSTSLLSYSPPSAAAILKSATQQIQRQPDESARSCSNVAIALQQQRRKTVYFTVGQRQEVAIFEDYTPSEDIKSKSRTDETLSDEN